MRLRKSAMWTLEHAIGKQERDAEFGACRQGGHEFIATFAWQSSVAQHL